MNKNEFFHTDLFQSSELIIELATVISEWANRVSEDDAWDVSSVSAPDANNQEHVEAVERLVELASELHDIIDSLKLPVDHL